MGSEQDSVLTTNSLNPKKLPTAHCPLPTAEQTVAMADKLYEAYHNVFEEILELEWRCARVTPWFMAQEGMVDTCKTPQKIKEGTCGCGERVGTTDYEAYLPLQRQLARVPEREHQRRQVPRWVQREDPERRRLLVRLLWHRARTLDSGVFSPERA